MPVPDVVYIQSAVRASGAGERARSIAPQAEIVEFDDLGALLRDLEGLPARTAKRRLVVAQRRGGFVKEFPGGRGVRAPDWYYFIPAIGCPADCRYCYLQGYHPANTPVVFAATAEMLEEMARTSRAVGGGYFYGGELCDSLMLEGVAGSISGLVELFRRLPDARLELRTKSHAVDTLLTTAPAANVVVSWTFSPPSVQTRFEQGAAGWLERIDAARRVQKHGYRIGVRFDPIILISGWRREYAALVRVLFEALDTGGVDFVQMGCLRFAPALKNVVIERFGESAPFDAEFVMGPDGKYRYPRPLRAAAYGYIADLIKSAAPGLPITLCMETPEMILP